ncbi:Arb2 domain-containing protein [Glomus cerebriforme]|uniref:Arb2 domain-containing protein n=1 Tax=Glomus cerebriforme TaxID=658196 RepID=A0A397TAN2_9GLOM|nr:Arb2 domain-containing protein [Glomus cerebriforme]
MFKKKKTKKTAYEFPRNLKELGYCIDGEGKLKTLGGEPYKFEVKEKDKAYNEGLYDVLIELISDWIQESLQKDHGMVRTLLPLGASETDIHTKIYLSPDYMNNENMIIFIPATSNTVGIWSRRVLADTSILEGSMIAYTKRARELGFSVVITNPNEVFWYKDRGVLVLPKTTSEFSTIPGSESPEDHMDYVFKTFVIPSAAQNIVIVANSYGGHCAIDVMQNNFKELKDRVKAIEFTATTHSIDFVKTDRMRVWVREHCRNWIMSDQPIGKEVIDIRFGCTSLSSGSDLNDFVTTNIKDEVFNFIERKKITWGANEANVSDDFDEAHEVNEELLDYRVVQEMMSNEGLYPLDDSAIDGLDIKDIREKIRSEEDPDSPWLN